MGANSYAVLPSSLHASCTQSAAASAHLAAHAMHAHSEGKRLLAQLQNQIRRMKRAQGPARLILLDAAVTLHLALT